MEWLNAYKQVLSSEMLHEGGRVIGLAWCIPKPYKELNHNIWFNGFKNIHYNINTIIVDRMGVLSTLAWATLGHLLVPHVCGLLSYFQLEGLFFTIDLKWCSWTLVVLESINTICAESMGRGEIASSSNIPACNAC